MFECTCAVGTSTFLWGRPIPIYSLWPRSGSAQSGRTVGEEEGCTWHRFFTLLHACLCMSRTKVGGLFFPPLAPPGFGLALEVFWPIARGGVVVSGCW